MSYKPAGWNGVFPYLIVTGAAGTIDFLKTVFAAVEIRRFADSTGRVKHAEVQLDDTVVMMADQAGGWPAVDAHVHVYVPDVDAVDTRALQAGASSVHEPVQNEDEDRRRGVKDPGGTTWWITTRAADH